MYVCDVYGWMMDGWMWMDLDVCMEVWMYVCMYFRVHAHVTLCAPLSLHVLLPMFPPGLDPTSAEYDLLWALFSDLLGYNDTSRMFRTFNVNEFLWG